MIDTRTISQFLMGLMLLFGGVTLIAKAVLSFRRRTYARGVTHILLGCLSMLLAVIAFGMAFS